MTYKDPDKNRDGNRLRLRLRKAEAHANECRAWALHRLLGIETFVHLQAVTDYMTGYDPRTGETYSPHQHRERVTLARV